ncbi:MAG: radical SAM protein [archaeon]
MKVLFIRNSSGQISNSRLNNGMGIIATIVHDAGHKVKILDNNSQLRFYKDEEIINIIEEFKPDVLAYSITLYNAYPTYEQIKKVKREFPKLKVIAGGIHMKHCFEEALEYGVDIVINREGEKVILPLLENIENLNKVKGVSYKKSNGSFHFAKEFPVLDNLDDVPIVNYDLFNLEDYDLTEQGLFDLTGQRGCPFKCTFCSDKIQRKDKRVASAGWMFSNIKDLYNKYGIGDLFIADNNITIFPKRLRDFCNKMIESGLNKKISLSCQTTIRFPIDDNLIKLMKKAGFNKVIFGLERLTSFSLKKINKEQPIENAHKIFKSMKKNDINISIFMMVGFPFETPALLKEEKKLFLELTKYTKDLHLSILTPIPATIYYDNYPNIKKWYLKGKDYELSRTYFARVLDSQMFETINRNFFNFPKETQKAMIDYYFTFKRISPMKINYLKVILNGADLFVAKISKGIFKVSPTMESLLFNRLKIIRYNFRRKVNRES